MFGKGEWLGEKCVILKDQTKKRFNTVRSDTHTSVVEVSTQHYLTVSEALGLSVQFPFREGHRSPGCAFCRSITLVENAW